MVFCSIVIRFRMARQLLELRRASKQLKFSPAAGDISGHGIFDAKLFKRFKTKLRSGLVHIRGFLGPQLVGPSHNNRRKHELFRGLWHERIRAIRTSD